MKEIFKNKLVRCIGYLVAEAKNNGEGKQRKKTNRDIAKAKQPSVKKASDEHLQQQSSATQKSSNQPNDDEVGAAEEKESEAEAIAKEEFLQRRRLIDKEGAKLTTEKCLDIAPSYNSMEGVIILL
jgi:hypothetical protein